MIDTYGNSIISGGYDSHIPLCLELKLSRLLLLGQTGWAVENAASVSDAFANKGVISGTIKAGKHVLDITRDLAKKHAPRSVQKWNRN